MPVRNALQALTMRPTQLLCSAWPWRSFAYLCTGTLVGAGALLAMFATVAAAVVLTVVVVGFLVYIVTVLAGMYVAKLERLRLRLVDFDAMPDPHRPPPRPGIRAWVMFRLKEAATWRELGYTLMSGVILCWIDAAVVGVVVYVPLLLLSTPFTMPEKPLWVSIPVALTGIPTAILLIYPVIAWAGARAALARAVLAPREESDVQLVEVTRSRARLLDAFEVERRRLERDLHDGAQQRLVALSMKLGLARLELPAGSPAADQVATAHDLAKQALTELRELIRGVHPKVLTDRGLEAAVGEIVASTPVPVEVKIELPGRLSSIVEVTAYFVVVEALTNVTRHSGAASCLTRAARWRSATC
jgi:signal transduction histidine kinase